MQDADIQTLFLLSSLGPIKAPTFPVFLISNIATEEILENDTPTLFFPRFAEVGLFPKWQWRHPSALWDWPERHHLHHWPLPTGVILSAYPSKRRFSMVEVSPFGQFLFFLFVGVPLFCHFCGYFACFVWWFCVFLICFRPLLVEYGRHFSSFNHVKGLLGYCELMMGRIWGRTWVFLDIGFWEKCDSCSFLSLPKCIFRGNELFFIIFFFLKTKFFTIVVLG